MCRHNAPEEVQQAVEEEIAKLRVLETASSEYNVSRNYLDWLTSMPYGVYNDEKFDIAFARQCLDEDHYGMQDVKDGILEFIAVGKLNNAVQVRLRTRHPASGPSDYTTCLLGQADATHGVLPPGTKAKAQLCSTPSLVMAAAGLTAIRCWWVGDGVPCIGFHHIRASMKQPLLCCRERSSAWWGPQVSARHLLARALPTLSAASSSGSRLGGCQTSRRSRATGARTSARCLAN